jgi:transcriptional regulator with XRE-family HTH domain
MALSLAPMTVSTLPRLEALRKARGLTRAQLGKELGFTERSVGRWENGESEPVLGDLRRIASFFGVSVGYLIGETER